MKLAAGSLTFIAPQGRARHFAAAALAMVLPAGAALADEPEPEHSLPAIEVEASRSSLLGVADAASEGGVGQVQIANRVVARTGEVLEVMPGLIASQHSGDGKANNYFLRGFNLDHGLDIKITLDGMPVNQRSHAHGQGWADLNPLIPELVSSLYYRKGPYYAADGDFANAGSAAIRYADVLDQGIASISAGQLGHGRLLLADAPKWLDGRLLYALELSHHDGPWVVPDNYRKANGLLRYSEGSDANGFSVTAMAYSGRWTATDQSWLVQAYAIRNQLDLYSNLEYGPDSQAAQHDSRVTSGLNVAHTADLAGVGKAATYTLGMQIQNDNVFNSLDSTTARVPNAECLIPGGGCRRDHITQSSIGLYGEVRVEWNDWFRSVTGLRGDGFRFNNVGQSNPANTDSVSDFIVSPKLNLVFGPWDKTEYYYSIGNGYHSNDARGVTIGSGPRANGLVRTFGHELGLRTEVVPGLQTTLALFQLDSASEIVYLGDEGRTEDSGRRSRRIGWEFNNYYKINRWLTLDADFAYARARFRDPGGEGRYIEGAVEGVASVAMIVDDGGPWSGALQLRYFGPRPLTEDNAVRSDATTTVNGRLRYRVDEKTSIELLGFNLLDSKNSAIDYYNDSYTFNGVSGLSGRVFHPMEPRNFRVALVTRH